MVLIVLLLSYALTSSFKLNEIFPVSMQAPHPLNLTSVLVVLSLSQLF